MRTCMGIRTGLGLLLGMGLGPFLSPASFGGEGADGVLPRPFAWEISPRPQGLFSYRYASVAPCVHSPLEGSNVIHFLAAPGDLITVVWERPARASEGETPAVEKAEYGVFLLLDEHDNPKTTLAVDADWTMVRADGKPIGVVMPMDATGPEAAPLLRRRLEALPAGALRSLRTLMLPEADSAEGDPPAEELASWKPLIERLAQARPPRLTLCVESPALARLLIDGLEPANLVLPEGGTTEVFAALSGKSVQRLIFPEGMGEGVVLSAASFPALRGIGVWDGDELILPSAAPELRALKLNEEIVRVPGLTGHRSLARLCAAAELVAGVDVAAAFPDLRSLGTTVSKLPTVPTGLKHLAFLADKGVTPELLHRVVRANPDLAIVEFLHCNELTDLAALQTLAHLECLLFMGTDVTDMKTLNGLASVRFFALSPKLFEKEAGPELAQLRAGHPDAAIVPVDGLCLGSGWILVLLPALAAAALAGRRSRRTA